MRPRKNANFLCVLFQVDFISVQLLTASHRSRQIKDTIYYSVCWRSGWCTVGWLIPRITSMRRSSPSLVMTWSHTFHPLMLPLIILKLHGGIGMQKKVYWVQGIRTQVMGMLVYRTLGTILLFDEHCNTRNARSTCCEARHIAESRYTYREEEAERLDRLRMAVVLLPAMGNAICFFVFCFLHLS